MSETLRKASELIERGRFAEAIPELERALAELEPAASVQPSAAEDGPANTTSGAGAAAAPGSSAQVATLINLGVALLETGQVERAVERLERARGLAPGSEDVYYNLGVGYEKLGRLDAALEAYRKAVELRPFIAESRCNLGNIYREKEMLTEAIQEYRAAVDLNPNFALAHNNLAVACAMAGDLESAAFHAGIAQALEYPVHPDFVRHLKQVREQQKK